MTDSLVQIVVWLSRLADGMGRFALAPIAWMPGWLSATVVSAATAILLLVVFKHTSRQLAIKRVRDDIQAQLLAVRLFKDNVLVTFRAEGRILLGAVRLMLLAVVPMLVMTLPVCLLLAQLALWYQCRPLGVGEETVVTVTIRDGRAAQSRTPTWGHWSAAEICMEPSPGIEVTAGPIRVLSKRQICWGVKGRKKGRYRLAFQVGPCTACKQLVVGDGFMRLDAKRPSWNWSDVLLHPAEPPFRPESPVASIEIAYPDRQSWVCGTNGWVVYWLGASMLFAFCVRPWLHVRI